MVRFAQNTYCYPPSFSDAVLDFVLVFKHQIDSQLVYQPLLGAKSIAVDAVIYCLIYSLYVSIHLRVYLQIVTHLRLTGRRVMTRLIPTHRATLVSSSSNDQTAAERRNSSS